MRGAVCHRVNVGCLGANVSTPPSKMVWEPWQINCSERRSGDFEVACNPLPTCIRCRSSLLAEETRLVHDNNFGHSFLLLSTYALGKISSQWGQKHDFGT